LIAVVLLSALYRISVIIVDVDVVDVVDVVDDVDDVVDVDVDVDVDVVDVDDVDVVDVDVVGCTMYYSLFNEIGSPVDILTITTLDCCCTTLSTV